MNDKPYEIEATAAAVRRELEQAIDNIARLQVDRDDEATKRRALEAENKLLRELLVESNDVLRSAHEVAKRQGMATHWRSFKYRVKDALGKQHRFMHGADGGE